MSSTIVGALSCQMDSYLRTLSTRVISCRPVQLLPPKAEKGKTAAKIATEGEVRDVKNEYEVELEDTIIFPEGIL